MITFTVDGEPCVKQRPRFSRVGKYVKTYTPAETTNYENWVKLCYMQQIGEMAYTEDVSLQVSITAFYSVPKAWSKKKTQQALNGEIKPHNAKDVDNTAKIILDALNGVAYKDDHFITDLYVCKRYSDIPRVEITIDVVTT